jgi:hypothetical protein
MMFITLRKEKNSFARKSKHGTEHNYVRYRTVALFRCDECHRTIERPLKKVDSKRLSNRYFHCCVDCDPKRFAQRKGVEQKKIWDLLASSELPVGKY